jgi:D-3-phosphoglycerate dehydrogenase
MIPHADRVSIDTFKATAMIPIMAENAWRIVFSEVFSSDALTRMQTVGTVRQLSACDEQSLLQAVGECDALLVRTASQVTRRVIEAAPHLRVIGRGGVGLDNIDLEAAREHGVTVVYTPTAATESVADLTFALMLGLIWDTKGSDRAIRSGRFLSTRNTATPRELGGLTLGIIGMGRIGRAVARRAINGFLMEVLYNDIDNVGGLGFPATRVEKEELYRKSDIVSLHVPLTSDTRGLIGASALNSFRKGAFLINTSRGAVVDAKALTVALQSGQIGGAGLDVFEPEPLPADHPLLTAPNTLFTPHVGARTEKAQMRMNSVVDDVIRVLNGETPQDGGESSDFLMG